MIDLRIRGRAALIHLGASAVVAGLAAALVFGLWYPWPYTVLAGGTALFVLVCSVDVVMGPVITFTVFDRRKRRTELQRDLAVVVALQLAALGYGLFTMHQARPVGLALETDRLRVVTANAVVLDELPEAPPALRQLPLTGPIQLRTVPPKEPGEQMAAIERALAGEDLGVRPRYWRPWDDAARAEAKASAQPLDRLRQRYPGRAAELDAAVVRSGRVDGQLGFLPIVSRHADWVALVDKGSGDIAGFAPFNGY